MEFRDNIEILGIRKRAEDGVLLVDARVARTGVQEYRGSEVGRPDLPVVRVYRDPEEVFSDATMASFAHRPITNDHPREAVTASNWRSLAVGQTADEVRQQEKFIRVPLMVSDAATIDLVEAGKRELSAGYHCDLDWTAGITADGEAFDARQKNIRVNHIAIVEKGRAGPECRIGDSKGNPNMVQKIITVDGLPVTLEVSDQAAAYLDHLQGKVGTLTADLATANGKVGTLTAEIATLRDAAPKPEQIDAMVRDRAALVATANRIVPNIVTDGKTDADIKRAVLSAKLGDAALAGLTSDEAINGAFTVIAKDVKPATVHPMADAFKGTGAPLTGDDRGEADRIKRLQDAYK